MSVFSHRIRIRSDQLPYPGTRAATRRLVERRGPELSTMLRYSLVNARRLKDPVV